MEGILSPHTRNWEIDFADGTMETFDGFPPESPRIVGDDVRGVAQTAKGANRGWLSRPFGTQMVSTPRHPTLKRWAILECPSGTGPEALWTRVDTNG